MPSYDSLHVNKNSNAELAFIEIPTPPHTRVIETANQKTLSSSIRSQKIEFWVYLAPDPWNTVNFDTIPNVRLELKNEA